MAEYQQNNSDLSGSTTSESQQGSQSGSGSQALPVQLPPPPNTQHAEVTKPPKKLYVSPEVVQHKPLKSIMSEKAFAKAT